MDFSSKENAKKPWHTGRNRETSSKRGPKRKKKKVFSLAEKKERKKKKNLFSRGKIISLEKRRASHFGGNLTITGIWNRADETGQLGSPIRGEGKTEAGSCRHAKERESCTRARHDWISAFLYGVPVNNGRATFTLSCENGAKPPRECPLATLRSHTIATQNSIRNSIRQRSLNTAKDHPDYHRLVNRC